MAVQFETDTSIPSFLPTFQRAHQIKIKMERLAASVSATLRGTEICGNIRLVGIPIQGGGKVV